MKELIRTKVNEFNLKDAITIEELEIMRENIPYISVEQIFNTSNAINLEKRKLELFLNGVMLTYNKDDGIYKIYNDNKFMGLGIIKNNLLKRDVVI